MKVTAVEALVISLILFGASVVAPRLGIILSCAAGVFFVLAAHPKYLPALVALLFERHNIPFAFFHGVAGIKMGGMYLTPTLVITATAAGYAILHCKRLTARADRRLLLLWLSAFGPCAVICYRGFALGHNGWSNPLRMLFVPGAFFFGILISRRLKRPTDIFDLFTKFLTVLSLLGVLRFFHHRILFFNAALLPAYALLLWRNGKGREKLWPVFMLAVITAYCMDLRGTQEVFAVGEGGTTFTLIGLYVLSSVLALVFYYRITDFRSFASNLMGLPALLAVVLFMVLAVHTYENFNVAARLYNYQQTLDERLTRKIYFDRGRVWKANLEFILTPPFFLKPGGSPVHLEGYYGKSEAVQIGAHNAFLQSIRSNGWYSGVVMIVLLVVAVVRSTRVYRHTKDSQLRALAIAVLATLTYGGMTGHYPVGTEIGTILFALAGLSHGLFLLENPGDSGQKAPPPRHSFVPHPA